MAMVVLRVPSGPSTRRACITRHTVRRQPTTMNDRPGSKMSVSIRVAGILRRVGGRSGNNQSLSAVDLEEGTD